MKKLMTFIKEVVTEFRRVVWPSRESVSASVRVVLVSTLLTALFLAAVDILSGNLVFLLLGV